MNFGVSLFWFRVLASKKWKRESCLGIKAQDLPSGLRV